MKKIYPLQLESVTAQSTVLNGFLKDNTLEDLIDTYLGNLLGDKVFSFYQGNLPITVEIKEETSGARSGIIVSPDDETSLPRYGCWGKERIIYILSAEKDSSVYIGFSKNLTATEIYERSISGNLLEAMNEIGPEEGETFYIRPGVPFCIGRGVRYVEVAQNSTVEFNIEDVDQLVEALDFINIGACIPEYIAPENSLFRMERIAITKPQTIAPDQTESFMVILNLRNQTQLKVNNLRGSSEITNETCLTLQTGAADAADSTNSPAQKPDNIMALIPHDISELTLTPSQEGENPSSSFLRIYMCNTPEPPEEDQDEGCNDQHDHNEGQHHNCRCGN